MDSSPSRNSRNPRDTWDSVTATGSPERVTFENEDKFLSDSEKAENIHEIVERVRCLVDKSARDREYADKVNKRWYPIILFMIAVNFFLWIAMLYAVFDADHWSTNRSQYLAYTWILFFIPLLAASFFIFSPWPKAMRAGRNTYSTGRASPQWKNFVNAFSAIACFIIIVVYVYTRAIPDYNEINWEMTVNFTNTLEIPSAAFILQHSGPGYQNLFNYSTTNGSIDFAARLYRGGQTINYPKNSLITMPFNRNATLENGDVVWYNYTIFVANSSLALQRNTTGSPTATALEIALDGNFNSSINSSISSGLPNLQMALFDPRLQIRDMYSCGLVPWTTITPFSSNYMSFSMMHIVDQLKNINAPSSAAKYCTGLYRNLLSQTQPRFVFYEPNLMGSIPNTRDYVQDCDVALKPNASCSTGISFEYGNQFVLSRETQRGTTTLDIWSTAGALVGAVQFFAWFWLQAVGG